MTVELISVGTEILLGNIVNTNAAYLAEKTPFWDFPATTRARWETMRSVWRMPSGWPSPDPTL